MAALSTGAPVPQGAQNDLVSLQTPSGGAQSAFRACWNAGRSLSGQVPGGRCLAEQDDLGIRGLIEDRVADPVGELLRKRADLRVLRDMGPTETLSGPPHVDVALRLDEVRAGDGI